MSDPVENLEKAVSELNPAKLKQFANWFMDFGQAILEREIAADPATGPLDFLFEEAIAERAKGEEREWARHKRGVGHNGFVADRRPVGPR